MIKDNATVGEVTLPAPPSKCCGVGADRWKRDLLLVAFLGAAVNGAIGLGIVRSNSAYLGNCELNANPDALHYILLGHNIWSNGKFSREAGPPYTPDVMRTPVYPVVVGGLTASGSVAWPLYLFQVLCAVGTNLLTYAITRRLWGRGAALVASASVALCFSLATLNFEAMSEPLFTLLSTLAAALWLRYSFGEDDASRRLRNYIILGALLAVAVLTRPAAVYLPVVFGCALLIKGLLGKVKRRALGGVVVIVTAYALISPWVLRNYVTFGIARLTTADTINLVYFAGAGAYQVELAIEAPEAQARISSEFGLVPLVATNNAWTSRVPVAEMDAAQRRALPKILLKYPKSLVVSTVTGLAKSAIGHNIFGLAHLWNKHWTPPGLGTAFKEGPREFARRAFENDPGVLGAFGWDMLLTFGSYFGAAVGVVAAIRRSAYRWGAVCLLLIIAYYALTIGVVGLDAYFRHRAMVIPLVAPFVGLGWCIMLRYVRGRPMEGHSELPRLPGA